MNEESMKGKASSRIAPVEDLEELETTLFEMFQVESTGASISTDCSIPLLHRYCEVLAHDSFGTSTLSFNYSSGGSGDVKCEVFFTTGEILQRVEGRPASSPSDAKRIACLDACKHLYECGMLTDRLLPKNQEDERPLVNAAQGNNHVPEKLPSQVHSTIVPEAFSGTWAMAESGVTLYAYTVSFVPTPNDRAYVNFGLFIESDLGPDAGFMDFELQLRNRRLVKAECSPSGRLDFELHQLQDAKLFQERLISTVLDRTFGHNITGEWNSNRLYLLLPLKENVRATSHLSIDWECIAKVISDVEYKPLKNTSQDDECGDHRLLKIQDGDVPKDFILDSVVQTVHNRFIYFARELRDDLTAMSPMLAKPKETYFEFFEQKHNTTLQHLQQPMLKAKPFIQVHNLLTVHNNSERPAADELKAEQSVELPLELCKIMVRGISCGLANGASLLPSFMHRLEGQLLAIQLRETLSQSYPEASTVRADTMLAAITTSKCQESFSLEALEHLGDAFLEAAVSKHLFVVNNNFQEGKLSQLRTSIICNSALEKLGKERGIMNYIRDIQFCPNDWAAPGRAIEYGKENISLTKKKTRRQESVLQGKTIADVVEALIGAHYLWGRENAAQSMMRWFGCEVGVDPQKRHEARTRKNGQQGLLQASKIDELENLLTYKFENKDLLVEALTHASYSSRDSYQRLEFLGDAVLDFLITKHFYMQLASLKRDPGVNNECFARVADPGLLTDLRSAAVNNECFARVAVRHSLHEYLLLNNEDVSESINSYVKFVQDSRSDAQSSCHGWAGDDGPKVLSDLVESLAGAVFVDSNFDLDIVWRVFEQILRPLVTPETLRLEPTRELRELCQSLKFNDPEFKKTHGAKGDFEIAVTVYMNDTEFTEVARKADNKSAKKAAAIQALAKLKNLGKEHFKSRLLKREALSRKPFSPLVDVPEAAESTNTNADINITDANCCDDLGVVGPSTPSTQNKTGSDNVESAQKCESRNAEWVNQFTSLISYSGHGTDVMHQSRESVCSRDDSSNQVDSGDDIFHDAPSTLEHCTISTPPDAMDIATSSSWETWLNYQGSDSAVQNPNHRDASAIFKSQKNTAVPDIATIPLYGHDYVQRRDQEHPNLVDTLHSGPAYHSELYSIVDYLRRSKISDLRDDPMSTIAPTSAKSTHLEGSSSYLFSGAAATDCSDPSCHQSSHYIPPATPPSTKEPGPGRQLAKGEARSKLNELCVKQRWKDPEYKRVSIGGLSHAPVYKYMVMTTFCIDGKEYEIEVEGEPAKDIKGAKDSAAMQALVWFEDYGFVCW